MRLAVFTNQFPGPVCTFFARDMRGLIEAGIDVEVFAIYPLDQKLWHFVPEILNERILPRIKVHHLGFGKILRSENSWSLGRSGRFLWDSLSIGASAIRYGVGPLMKSSYVFPKAWVWALNYSNQFDHVLAYWGNYAGTCAYLFHRALERVVPFSLFFHAGTDLYRTPVFMRSKLLYADNIITCSSFNRQFIRESYSDIADLITKKIHVHHHGLDLSEFAFESNGRLSLTVIAVGRLDKTKGFDFLLKAAWQLIRDGVQVKVELVGDGSEREYLETLTNDLRIGDRVTFRGWLSPDQTRDAMKEATILVHPSTGLGDGVPNVIKECMALGTPVIASAVAGIPELLGDGKFGILVPPNDVTPLATAVRFLLSNPDARSKYSHFAREFAEERFNLWCNGKNLSELLCSTTR